MKNGGTTMDTITGTTAPTLDEAVRSLAGMCDGAQAEDGVGYNASDTDFGRFWARIPEDAWSPKVRRALWEMIRKYRGQLGGVHGIDFGAIHVPYRAEVTWEDCMGCGVCEGQCATGAVTLVRDERKGVPLDVRALASRPVTAAASCS